MYVFFLFLFSDVHSPVSPCWNGTGTEPRDVALKERNRNQEEARLPSKKKKMRNKERKKVLFLS